MGRMLGLLNIVDEFTRVSSAMRVDRPSPLIRPSRCSRTSLSSAGAWRLCAATTVPSDRQPLRDWCAGADVTTRYIESGSPRQNPFASPSTRVSATSC